MLSSGTSYEFYLETDLDALDEPVDYSSKYQERYSYKDNAANNFKVGNETTVSEVKQASDEGENTKSTPLSISLSSSCCDLQNIVANNDQLSPCNRETSEVIDGNCPESDGMNVSFTTEKDIVNKGSLKGKISKEKSVTFGRSSVSETPLMFSRSSSVDSLSSFEQQSLFDDRSYVSALSTPASGVLSPSELPASPSELMSPGLLKSKSTFQFPIPKGTRELPLSINFKLKEQENDADLLNNGVFDDTPKMFSDEGRSSTTSSLSSLSFYEGSVRVSVSVLDQKTNENIPLVEVPNDEASSYAFADTKKEYKYEGQKIASNDYEQNESADHCYYQLNLNSTQRSANEHEHVELSSFVFEDTRNCYDDEGKFSTTSSLSSISFLDHCGDHVPDMFQPVASSGTVSNVLHPDNSSGLKDSETRFELHEKSEPNQGTILVETSLQQTEVCEEDSASEESDYDSEQERKDKELIDQLLTNSLEVSKSDLTGDESESSESEYDSEQERKDQELIEKLLAPSLPAQVPKSNSLSINQKPDLLKSCAPKDRTHAPSKIFTSRGRETSSKQGSEFEKQQVHKGLKCSPVEVYDESSESDYDSEQERRDQELINKLFTTTMPLQVPKRNILDDRQSVQVSRSRLPKDTKNGSPNFSCKTSRDAPQLQDYRNEQLNKYQYRMQYSHDQVSDESNESDYDPEQEMKDQELINTLLQPTMSIQGSRHQNSFADHQVSNGSKSSYSNDMKGASPKNFTYRASRNVPQYRGDLSIRSQCNVHCSHVQGYRDSVPDGSPDVNEKSDKLLMKLSNARKADKTMRNAKHMRQSYNTKTKQGCQIHKALTSQNNFYDRKQHAQYSLAGRTNNIERHANDTTVMGQSSDMPWSSDSNFVEINDSARVYIYRTEESPIITRSPSLSDLNVRPSSDDKNNHERFVKNSRK